MIDWEPPAGMPSGVRTAWRTFYREAWNNYGVTAAFYRQMYLAQSGRCYICRIAKGIHPDDPNGRGGRRLGIDHSHAIGNRIEAVRGLLCTGSLDPKTCNRLIAVYSYGQLERATRYLTTPPAQVLRAFAGSQDRTDAELTGWLT
jgi:hypothetical protein